MRSRSVGREETISQGVTLSSAAHMGNTISEGVATGDIKPENVVVDIPTPDPSDLPKGKPWYSVRGLWTYVAHQRQKIPRAFRRIRAQREGRQEKPTTNLPTSILTGGNIYPGSNQLQSNGIYATNTGNSIESGDMLSHPPSSEGNALLSSRLEDHVASLFTQDDIGRGTAFLANVRRKDDEESGADAMVEDSQGLTSLGRMHDAGPYSETQQVSSPEAHEDRKPPTGSRKNGSETEEAGKVYHPTPAKKDCDDFAFSAVLFKNSAGEQDSTKLFYDTGSENNIASEKFVEQHGLMRRPILPEHLKVYDTAAGVVFAPTHYVEVELRDSERGIKEFTKTSFNVAQSMKGPGLLVGREFMIYHGISLHANEGRGAYVLTSRKASDGKQDRMYYGRQRLTRLLRRQESANGSCAAERRRCGKSKGVRSIKHWLDDHGNRDISRAETSCLIVYQQIDRYQERCSEEMNIVCS
jgi:hypothetical protein